MDSQYHDLSTGVNFFFGKKETHIIEYDTLYFVTPNASETIFLGQTIYS